MKNRTVTTDQFLTQLTRMGTANIRELARALGTTQENIQPLIANSLHEGRIVVGYSKAEPRYKIPKPKAPPKERLTTSIARPAAPPPMRGEITGYTDAMRQRVELAMLGRGRS